MDGYGVEFAEKPDPLLQTDCAICHLVLRKPCETTCCGVYFCRACLERSRQHNLSCPHCRRKLKWHESRAQERLINQLKVVCKYKSRGCEWIGELGQWYKHLNENSLGNADTDCKFVTVECPSCKEIVNRGDYDQHKTENCLVSCPHCRKGCDWKGQEDAIDEHLNLDPQETAGRFGGCGYVQLDCTCGCGKSFARRKLEKHEDACRNELLECEFKEFGCTAKVPRKDMQEHLQENYHVQQLRQACAILSKMTREHKSLIDKINATLQRQEGDIQKVKVDATIRRQNIYTEKVDAIRMGQKRDIDMLRQQRKISELFRRFKVWMKQNKHGLLLSVIILIVAILIGVSMKSSGKSVKVQRPAILTLSNYSMYKALRKPWISRVVWSEKEFSFSLHFLSDDASRSHVQFSTTSQHCWVKANITLQILGNSQHKLQTFQVQFVEWDGDVVTGYEFLDTDVSSFLKDDKLVFQVVKVQTDNLTSPCNSFVVCDWFRGKKTTQESAPVEFSISVPFASIYVSLRLALVLKSATRSQALFSVYQVDYDKRIDGNFTLSFYLSTGGILNHTIAFEDERNSFTLPWSEFQEIMTADRCLMFSISKDV